MSVHTRRGREPERKRARYRDDTDPPALVVYVVEDHNEALPALHLAMRRKLLPMHGLTMVHFDAHPDLLTPKRMRADCVFQPRVLYDELRDSDGGIAEWIMPLAFGAHLSHCIWVKPQWCAQLGDGSEIFDVGAVEEAARAPAPGAKVATVVASACTQPTPLSWLEAGRARASAELCASAGLLRTSSKQPYFLEDGCYCPSDRMVPATKRSMRLTTVTVHEARDAPQAKSCTASGSSGSSRGSSESRVALDICLDFLGTRNPFLDILLGGVRRAFARDWLQTLQQSGPCSAAEPESVVVGTTSRNVAAASAAHSAALIARAAACASAKAYARSIAAASVSVIVGVYGQPRFQKLEPMAQDERVAHEALFRSLLANLFEKRLFCGGDEEAFVGAMHPFLRLFCSEARGRALLLRFRAVLCEFDRLDRAHASLAGADADADAATDEESYQGSLIDLVKWSGQCAATLPEHDPCGGSAFEQRPPSTRRTAAAVAAESASLHRALEAMRRFLLSWKPGPRDNQALRHGSGIGSEGQVGGCAQRTAAATAAEADAAVRAAAATACDGAQDTEPSATCTSHCPARPAVVTVARSADDGFCPSDVVDARQGRVLALLEELYGPLDVRLAYKEDTYIG